MKVISTISNNNDWYLITADFEEYIKMQEQVIYFLTLDRQGMAKPRVMDQEVNLQWPKDWQIQ